MRKRYWEVIPGQKPILLVASHNYPVLRGGRIKPRDLFTGSMVEKLCSLTKCWGIVSKSIQSDPNWYKNSPFRKVVKRIISENNIAAVLDIHGRKSSYKRLIEFYPNSEFEKSFGKYLKNLPVEHFKRNIQLTIAEDLDSIRIPCIEIEIRKDGRTPGNENFDIVIPILEEIIDNIANRNKVISKFDRAYWESQLKHPDWYVRLEKELEKWIFPIVHGDPVVRKFRHQAYELIEELLKKGEIPLATEGPNFDTKRKPIDTIIIHHTEEGPNIRLNKLSAIGLLRQYGLRYLQNDVLGRELRGQPIWSNHFWDDRMVFYAYHWLIRPDGKAERLLKDEYIGWHAGVWKINTRSVGIALSGNYEHKRPPIAQIESIAMVIKKYYPQIDKKRIFGHLEVKKGKTCPGEYFLKEWKAKLLNLI